MSLAKKKNALLGTLILILGISFFPLKTRAADIGVGIMVGDPTGVTLKVDHFPVIGLAWSFSHYLQVNCDYWVLEKPFFQTPLNWFVGVGGKLLIADDSSKGPFKDEDGKIGIGVRIPVGLQYYLIKELEVFGELAPGIYVIPGTDFSMDWGLGIRYHF